MPDGAYPFVQAKNCTRTQGRTIDLIVIHDMEVDEDSLTAAEGVANYFAGANAPRASTHYSSDQDSTVQSVEDHDVAWGAPGVNHNGLHFEHAGYARQSREEWLDEASMNVLRQSAPLTKRKALEYGIPLVHITPEELAAGARGFIGHVDATRAFNTAGGHTDPGANFPWDVYMEMVGGAASSYNPPPPEVVQEGVRNLYLRVPHMTGQDVADWQKVVGPFSGMPTLRVDADFGPLTSQQTKVFQQKQGLKDDGIVGPKTRQKMADCIAYVTAFSASQPANANRPMLQLEKPYMRGEHVQYLQHRLHDLGHGGAGVSSFDGVFGPAVQASVISFQQEQGLKPDGIVGPLTWAALG